MSDTTGERSCYTLSTARDEVVRTDRNGGSIFRELPRILPPSVATVAFSETSCGRILPPTACRHLRAFPMARTAPPEEQYPDRRCSRDYSCKRRMYFGCPRPGYVQNSQSRPKGTDYLYKCGKSPDTACPCRERYGMRQSGLCDGFQEYDRQQPPRGLLPVMIPIRCDFDPVSPRENIFLGDIIRSRDRWFPGRSPDGYFPYAFRTGITESNRPPRRLPNPSPRFHPPRCRRLAGNDRFREGLVSISSRSNIDWKLSRRMAAMTTMTITATATIIPMSFLSFFCVSFNIPMARTTTLSTG